MTKSQINQELLFGLSLDDIHIIQNILAYYPSVQTVSVFGSRAKGNHKYLSDLDLVIIGTGQDLAASIKFEIDQSDFPWAVDVIGYDAAIDKPFLKSEIDKFSKVFWTRDESIIDQNILRQSQKDVLWDKSQKLIFNRRQFG